MIFEQCCFKFVHLTSYSILLRLSRTGAAVLRFVSRYATRTGSGFLSCFSPAKGIIKKFGFNDQFNKKYCNCKNPLKSC